MISDDTKKLVHLLLNNKEISRNNPGYELIKNNSILLRSIFRGISMELRGPEETLVDSYFLAKIPYKMAAYHSDEFMVADKYSFSTAYHYILFYLTIHQIDDYYIRGQEQFLYTTLLNDVKALSLDWLEKDLLFEPRNYTDLSVHSDILSYFIANNILEVVAARTLGRSFSYTEDSDDELILKILPSFKNLNIRIENIDFKFLEDETIEFEDKRFDYHDFKTIAIQALLSQYYLENDGSVEMKKLFNEIHSDQHLRSAIGDWFEENTFFRVAFSQDIIFLYDNQEETGLSNLLFPKASETANDTLEFFRYVPFLKREMLSRKLNYYPGENGGYIISKNTLIDHFKSFTKDNPRLSWSKEYQSISDDKKWSKMEDIGMKYGLITRLDEDKYRLSDAIFMNGYQLIATEN